MRLIDVAKALGTDEQCLAYFERRRWPNGVRCLTCGNDKISKITRKTKTKNKRAQVYQCLEPTCKQQFSCTTGTIFHDSHLSLSKWFMAVALIVDAKKGMSALQLQRHLGCNYRTAWYLAHRIREAMDEPEGLKLKGTVARLLRQYLVFKLGDTKVDGKRCYDGERTGDFPRRLLYCTIYRKGHSHAV